MTEKASVGGWCKNRVIENQKEKKGRKCFWADKCTKQARKVIFFYRKIPVNQSCAKKKEARPLLMSEIEKYCTAQWEGEELWRENFDTKQGEHNKFMD